jgi:DNA-binding response OmpR family regulator
LRLAIFTNDSGMFGVIRSTLADDGIECAQYGEEVELARALHREEFAAIVFDASAGLDPSHPVLTRRACFDDRRAPLIAIGDFCAREQMHAAVSAGADDIVLMPVDPRELRLRVLLAVRRFGLHQPDDARVSPHAGDALQAGVYRLNRRDGSACIDGRAVRLTAREFAIAWVLFSQQGHYVTRRALAAAVWGSSEEIAGRTLEQHIYKLRKKLLLDGAQGIALRTMYAHGYRIEEVIEAPAPRRERETARGACPKTAGAIKLHASASETARNAQPWSAENESWGFLAVASRSGRVA